MGSLIECDKDKARCTNSPSAAEDYAPFNDVWNKPDGGLHAYLVRFLGSPDITFQHIAVWTIVQLLEAEDEQLTNNIRSSQILIHAIRQLATDPTTEAGGASKPPAPPSGVSDSSFDDDAADNEGEGEISALAKRILELSEGEKDKTGTAAGPTSGGNGPQYNPSGAGSGETTTGGGGQHDDLRASVQRALSGQQ